MARDIRSQLSEAPISHLLHTVGQFADKLLLEELRELQVTPRQVVVLVAIADLQSANHSELVAKTGIDRSTMSDVVSRLIRNGVIESRPDPRDARANAVRLTQTGRKLVAPVTKAVKRADERIVGRLSVVERDLFRSTLRRLALA